jgi:hypothetical protein
MRSRLHCSCHVVVQHTAQLPANAGPEACARWPASRQSTPRLPPSDILLTRAESSTRGRSTVARHQHRTEQSHSTLQLSCNHVSACVCGTQSATVQLAASCITTPCGGPTAHRAQRAAHQSAADIHTYIQAADASSTARHAQLIDCRRKQRQVCLWARTRKQELGSCHVRGVRRPSPCQLDTAPHTSAVEGHTHT